MHTALLGAAIGGHLQLVRELIQGGACLDNITERPSGIEGQGVYGARRDGGGRTALGWAEEAGYTEIVTLLTEAGAQLRVEVAHDDDDDDEDDDEEDDEEDDEDDEEDEEE